MHLLASNVIKYSLFAISLAHLGGCGGPSAEDETSSAPTVDIISRPEVSLDPPSSVDPEGVRLLRAGKPIYLGDSEDKVFTTFGRPPRTTDFFEEPPITGEEYQARGWQGSGEGFGAIFLRDRLVLAQQTLEKVSEVTVLEIETEYDEAHRGLPMTLIPGKYGSYRFWTKGDTRAMLVKSQGRRGQVSLTLVIGMVPIMDALRMSETAAREDLFAATRTLEEQQEQIPSSR